MGGRHRGHPCSIPTSVPHAIDVERSQLLAGRAVLPRTLLKAEAGAAPGQAGSRRQLPSRWDPLGATYGEAAAPPSLRTSILCAYPTNASKKPSRPATS